MKYVTMPKITEEQHRRFIEAAQGAESPAQEEMLVWLRGGRARTAARKGCANDILPEFVRSGKGFLSRVHDNGGTLVACNSYMAAVILPEGTDSWDMSGAYMLQDDSNRWTTVQESFGGCLSLTRGSASESALAELLQSCKAAIKEHRRLPRSQRSGAAVIRIDAQTMKSISAGQAADLYAASSGSPMGFDAGYLETVLRFILCAGTDAEVYYSKSISPIHMRAGSLYVLLNPLRMKWEREDFFDEAG